MNKNNQKFFKESKKKRNKRLENLLNRFRLSSKGGNSFNYSQRIGHYKFDSYISSRCQIILMPGISCEEAFDYNLSIPFSSALLFIKPQFEREICPICLEYPFPSAITKCGHVYCFKCILAYIVINESENSCFCPVCNFILTRSCIKLVLWSNVKEIKIGDQVTFYLCAKRNSSDISISTVGISLFENHFMLNLNITLNEHLIISGFPCLNRVIEYPKGDTSILNLLEYLQKSTKDTLATSDEYFSLSYYNKALRVSLNYFSCLHQTLLKSSTTTIQSYEIEDSNTNTNNIYFYQMIDSFNMFLDSANIRQLKECYPYTSSKNNGWDQAPISVKGIVQSISTHVIDKSKNCCYKFLSHLPPFSEFKFCILKLTEPNCPQLSIENSQHKFHIQDDYIENKEENDNFHCLHSSEEDLPDDFDEIDNLSSTFEEELECIYLDELEDNKSRNDRRNKKNTSKK